MYLSAIIITALFVISSSWKLNSEEATLPGRLSAVVPHGKRLQLSVTNAQHPEQLRWRFNGRPVSEKCEVTEYQSTSTLICKDMDWSDEGLYEYRGVLEDGRTEILLAVAVTVAECTEELATKQQEQIESMKLTTAEESNECFCSGITDQCYVAEDLYRSKITVGVTEAYLVDLNISSTNVDELRNVESGEESSSYYSVVKLTGNLLTSYGGYLDLPVFDDGVDEDGPDVVLKGKFGTVVYHIQRELDMSGEIRRTRILMKENSWHQLNGARASRDLFMTVLSNVRGFFVKSNSYLLSEPVQITLDSADIKDHGLGPVTTVEECNCREGYIGLSCERCARGYYRRSAVDARGICVSFKEKWDALKAAHEMEHRLRSTYSY